MKMILKNHMFSMHLCRFLKIQMDSSRCPFLQNEFQVNKILDFKYFLVNVSLNVFMYFFILQSWHIKFLM
jgi:hypothetical protein